MKTKDKNLVKIILDAALVLVGITSIVFSIICFTYNGYFPYTGYVAKETYGGDAYTGIQNAAAATANYVSALNTSLETISEAMMLGLGFCLMVAGTLIVVLGLKGLLVKDKAKAVETNGTIEI